MYRSGTELTPRRALWFVEHLPPQAAFRASLQGGPEFRGWDHQTYLFAAAVNLLNAANRQRAGKKTRTPLVKPPTTKTKVRRMSVAGIVARQKRLETNN